MNNSFGRRLERLRKSRNLNRKQLCQKIGDFLSITALRDLENQNSIPRCLLTKNLIPKLGAALNVSVSYLIQGIEDTDQDELQKEIANIRSATDRLSALISGDSLANEINKFWFG